MSEYLQLGEVRTWFDVCGEGDPLVLLHGGFSDARNFASNVDALAERFRVYLPERRGHGHTADVAGPITFEAMAQDTIAFLETVVGGPARIVGHSDGAIVTLLVGLHRPDLVERMVSISGNFHFDGLVPGAIDAEQAAHFVASSYAEVSPDGADHLPEFTAKMARLWTEEPTLTVDDLARITPRTLVMASDDDVATLEHTLDLYRSLPDAELAIVPGTSHVLILEKPDLCNRILLDFLTNDPVRTFLPIRRAEVTGGT
jgi:pimeloyl-ACP methyl ester carboxylesterase